MRSYCCVVLGAGCGRAAIACDNADMRSTVIASGFHIREHTIEVPWDRSDASLGSLQLYARELFTDENAPPLVYFQGGPGNPGPRMMMGWIPEALARYRVFLIDERGTGRSTRIDRTTPQFINADYLSRLRPPEIVADVEDLRAHLGFEQWDVLGNSFGGICVGAYLSYFPQGVRRAMITGSIPPFGITADEYNRNCLDLFEQRVERFYREVPWAEGRIRQVCAHLAGADERLPTGERLTPERFRFCGVTLGEEAGFETLAVLLEEPFHHGRHGKHLRTDFLSSVGRLVGLDPNPLWAVVHEQIFGGLAGEPVGWSAARVYEEREGFSVHADPKSDEQFYPFGNAFFPFHFEQDPALRPFRDAVDVLAQRESWVPVSDAEALMHNTTPTAALLYRDDMFIPYDYAVANADRIPQLSVTTNDAYQHDGIYLHGAEVFHQVIAALPD